MQIIHTLSELKYVITAYKRNAKVISLVPTMGNLHNGHLQLITMALAQSDIVVCSLFVNPLQFGENEDFEQYPRTLEADAEQLKKSHCEK